MSRTAEWNAIQDLLPYKPDLKQPKEQAFLKCFFAGLLGWQVQSLAAMTESELQQARAKWQTYLGVSEPVTPTAIVETPLQDAALQDETERFLLNRRLNALHTWQENYKPGEWGRAKLAQILGRDIAHFGRTFEAATLEELESIEHWMQHGELPTAQSEAEPEAPQPEEAATDGTPVRAVSA